LLALLLQYVLLHLVEARRCLTIRLEQTLLVAFSHLLHELVLVPPTTDEFLKRLATLPFASPYCLVSRSKRAGVAADVELEHALLAAENLAGDLGNSRVGS